MSMKLTPLAAAIATAAIMGQASAATTIQGITFPPGLVFNTITLFEGEDLTGPGNGNFYIDTVGEKLLGVGIVNQILDASNNIVWSNGDNGKELTFVISNYTTDFISPIGNPFPGTFIGNILLSGGQVKLYSQAVGTLDTGALTQAAAVTSASTGSLWLDLIGSPLGGQTTPGGNDTTLEVTSVSTNPNPFLSSTNVSGRGFLDVVGGAASTYFDTNTKGCVAGDPAPCPDDADFTFTSSGQLLVAAGPWGFRGTGEVEGFAEVPLPGTLALAGLGLLAGGLATRRRQPSGS
jgi:hypothetical protein